MRGRSLLWALCLGGAGLGPSAQEVSAPARQDAPLPFSVALRAHLRPPELDLEWNVVLSERHFRSPAEREREPPGPTPEAARAAVEAGTAGPQEHFSHGFALAQAGQEVEALESFNQAFALWRRAIALTPGDPDARLELARALGRFGRSLGSRRALEDALVLMDSVAVEGGARSSEASLEAAILGNFLTLVVPGDSSLLARARGLCERALENGARAHFALFALQQLELAEILPRSSAYEGREGDFYELLDARTTALRERATALEEPELVEACLNIGLSFMGVTLPLRMPGFEADPERWSPQRQAWSRRTRAALVACLPKLEGYPEIRAVAHERIWQLALLQEEGDEPALFERARASSPHAAGLAELRLAFASGLKRVQTQALARASLLSERDDARTRILLGTDSYRAGDFGAAAGEYQRAVDGAPERFEGWLGLGSALLAGSQDAAPALVALERAAGIDPGRAEIKIALAVGYALAGRNGEAALAAQAAVALSPADPDAQAVLALLDG